MKTARELHRDFKTMIITPEQIEEHKFINDCSVCKKPFNYKIFKVKHHNHFTGKHHSSICSEFNMQIKDCCKFLYYSTILIMIKTYSSSHCITTKTLKRLVYYQIMKKVINTLQWAIYIFRQF